MPQGNCAWIVHFPVVDVACCLSLVQNVIPLFPLFFIAHHIKPIVYGPLSVVQTFQTLAEPFLVNIVLIHFVVALELLKRFKASRGRIFFLLPYDPWQCPR